MIEFEALLDLNVESKCENRDTSKMSRLKCIVVDVDCDGLVLLLVVVSVTFTNIILPAFTKFTLQDLVWAFVKC